MANKEAKTIRLPKQKAEVAAGSRKEKKVAADSRKEKEVIVLPKRREKPFCVCL